MSVAIVIPARFASTRLPQKMLLSKTGWPLIRHTYEQAKKSKLAKSVLIATDNASIFNEVKNFGGDVVMTSADHPTGTDRLAEVAEKHLKSYEMIINVQGDEPELEPDNIDRLIELFQGSDAQMGTLVTPFTTSPLDPNAVKAVLGAPYKTGYQALYFSRSPIPYPRDTQGIIKNPHEYFMHLGIYAYQPDFLQHYISLPQGKLELTEKLEQLRILENGYKIVAGIVERAQPGIDTQADYDSFVQRWNEK